MPNTKKNDLQNAMVQAQQTPVEYVAFSGGGAKGAAYSGVYSALSDGGIIKNIKAVAGASAGAITAAFVATGITPQEFEKLSRDTNFKGLLGKKGAMMMNHQGTPLYELVKKTVQTNVSNYLNDNDIIGACVTRIENIKFEQDKIAGQLKPYLEYQDSITDKINGLKKDLRSEVASPAIQKMLQNQIDLLEIQSKEVEANIRLLTKQELDFQKQIEKVQSIIDNDGAEFAELKVRANSGGKICFKDLALLNLVNPERFKDLVITATRRDNGELTIFSPDTTPDVEIALAARASASIPLVFEPVTINGVQYVDGGYRDNTPTSHFKKDTDTVEDLTDNPEKTKEAKAKNRTLAFAFGSNDENDPLQVAVYSAKEKIYSPNMIVKFLMDVVFKMAAKVGGQFLYSDEEEKKYQRMRADALNVVMVDTIGVSTLSFDEAQKKADYLHVKGYIQTMTHMQNHELGTKYDPSLKHKEFMLEIFEKMDASVKGTWSSKVNTGREIKSEVILQFCKADSWKNNDKSVVIEKFIVAAAVSYKQGKLSNDTSAVEKLIESLNSPKTPNIVKLDFAKILGVKMTRGTDLAGFKFTKKDFEAVIEKNKNNVKLGQAKER